MALCEQNTYKIHPGEVGYSALEVMGVLKKQLKTRDLSLIYFFMKKGVIHFEDQIKGKKVHFVSTNLNTFLKTNSNMQTLIKCCQKRGSFGEKLSKIGC